MKKIDIFAPKYIAIIMGNIPSEVVKLHKKKGIDLPIKHVCTFKGAEVYGVDFDDSAEVGYGLPFFYLYKNGQAEEVNGESALNITASL